jgi:Zn-dependent protease with chaperone function
MSSQSSTQRRHQFEYLVDEAERALREDPRRYKLRLFLLGLLGYAVIAGTLFLIVALIGGTLLAVTLSTALLLLLFNSNLLFLLVVLGAILVKALWIRIEAPRGYRLERDRYPALFEQLDGLRRDLSVPPIHQIILTDSFNAAITQIPRLGIFGPYRNVLALGLPLLLSLTPEQARAVLAHEFGHLSSKNSGFNAWVYRVRASFGRILEAVGHTRGIAAGTLRRFFDWYTPYYWAYSFALARANEYEADAAASRLTSSEDAAAALVAVHTHGDLAGERFWSPLLARADHQPEPAVRPYAALHQFFKQAPLNPQEFQARIAPLLERRTDRTDTHPCLSDRLAALGETARAPGPIEQSAAEAWLGDGLSAILAAFDRNWFNSNRGKWRQRYQRMQETRAALSALKAKPDLDMTALDRWNLAFWSEHTEPGLDPLPLYYAYKEVQPDDTDVDLMIGKHLLARSQPEGLAYLERAANHRQLTLNACNLAISYLRRAGDAEAVERWRQRGEQYLDRENKARRERTGVAPGDTLLPPELSDEWIRLLRAQLLAHGKVRDAWIVRKAVQIFPEEPMYLIVVRLAPFARRHRAMQRLAAEVRVPGTASFMQRGALHRSLRAQVTKLGQRLI